jgi:hypothetical protein
LILINISLSPGTIDDSTILHAIYEENMIRNPSILLDKSEHVGVKEVGEVKENFAVDRKVRLQKLNKDIVGFIETGPCRK